MKALIDPASSVRYVTGWKKIDDRYEPVSTEIPNSARVCQVEPDANIFGVADPLYWEDCSEQIIADGYYLDVISKQFIVVPQPVPYPNQPVTQGAQTI